ncbi:MAG TPA: glycosyltransferase, partial [Kofleriaceae bacterium]|nr:glycosyltransferase [Kofleriaceae bacterium]
AAYASHGCLHARRGPLANPSAMVFRSEVAATRFGYPHAHITFESATVASYRLYREAVVSASALDFPSSRDDGPIYLGIPVDLDRDEDVPEALAGFVDPRRPLVYASLGSQTGRYPEEAKWFDAVVGAAANHPDWKVVLCAGERRLDAVSRAAPSNVLVLRWAPQLWLLERAAVFVTHAGLGGIREAIQAHVPMIAIPQGYDQPGNAARVEYHGIGVRVPAAEVSAPVLGGLIERILRGSDGMRGRLEQLDRACQAEAAEQRGVHVIEAAARRRPRASAARPPAPSSRPATPPDSNDRRLGWLFSNGAAALDAGAERHAPADVPLAVFVGGFTIATDLTEALRLATGPLLARVALAGEVIDVPPHRVGRTLRCVWTLDLTEVLYDHAAWCAEITVPELRRPFVRERIGRHRALIASGATDDAAAMARTLLTDANWYDPGEAGAACAMFGGPVVAAQNTTVYAADVWALGRVGDAAGTRAGAALFDAARIEFVRTLEAELERRVAAYALARGLALDPPPPP